MSRALTPQAPERMSPEEKVFIALLMQEGMLEAVAKTIKPIVDKLVAEEISVQRPVEASPLPGDIISAVRLLVDVYTQNDEQVGFTVQYAPLPPYVGPQHFCDAWGKLRDFLSDQYAAHLTKAEEAPASRADELERSAEVQDALEWLESECDGTNVSIIEAQYGIILDYVEELEDRVAKCKEAVS